MKSSDSLAKISPALVKALSAMEDVTKDAQNPAFKRDGKATGYASLGAVIEASKPILSAHGLAVMQGGGAYTSGALAITTRIIHESGEWIETTMEIPLAKADPQGAGSGVSYGRRYALMAILNMTAVDDDGNAATRPQPPPSEPKRVEQKAPTLSERAARFEATLKGVDSIAELDKAYALGSALCADLDLKDRPRLAAIDLLVEKRRDEINDKAAA